MRDYEQLDYEGLDDQELGEERLKSAARPTLAMAAQGQYAPDPADRSAKKRRGARAAGRISVLVIARNYARFLPDCLHSILTQTLRPIEIVYVDDGSEDESVAAARNFESCGVTVRALAHQGVAAARNEAAEAARGDYLLFVDGDNTLAPDYLECHLEALEGGAGFAYPSKQHFGLTRNTWQPGDYDRDRLWIDNYIDTCSLVRRELFDASGRWQETPASTLWDWDLWLRAGRYAEGTRSAAVLYYRHHDRNWSRDYDRAWRHRFGEWKGEVRRAAARVTVCCPWSGRLPGLFPRWLDALAASVSGLGRDRPELFILDDSPAGFWAAAEPRLSTLASAFSALRVVRVHEGVAASDRRRDRTATARHLSMLYNRFLSETASEVLWFVEDDIVVPPDAGQRLIRLLLDGERPKAAVSGFYRSRHEPCYVVSHTNGRSVEHARERPTAPEPYDLAGTGCLMVFRPLAKARFAATWKLPDNGHVVHAHDWVYTWQLREQGEPVWAHPDVVCRHYVTDDEWV